MLGDRCGTILGAGRPHAARFRAAAAVPGLQRNRRRRRARCAPPAGRASPSSRRPIARAAPCPFAEDPARARCAAPACAAAALSPGARRAGLRRQEPAPGPAVQARRPHRHCPRLRPLDGARRRRPAGRGRPGRAGAAALAPAVHAPLQPGAAAGAHRSSRRRRRRPGWPPTCCGARAGPARRPGSRPRSGARQRAAGLRPPSALGGGGCRASPSCWSTTC